MTSKNITVKYLARVEGEGGLNIQIKDNAVTGVQLKIFEPPRFFEAFLKGPQLHRSPGHHQPASAASARWPTR